MADPLTAIRAELDKLKALDEKAVTGPWEVWGGPDYVGGGADLCIGAGKTWLANMDHRNCVNREQHVCGMVKPCALEGDTSVCSMRPCNCDEKCPVDVHISEEQRAVADFIAAARTSLPRMAKAMRVAVDMMTGLRMGHMCGGEPDCPCQQARATLAEIARILSEDPQ